MEKTDCRELLEVHRNAIDVESIAFLMILLAPEVSFVTLHMRWPKASTKTTGATIGYNVLVANNNLRYNLRLP